MMNIEGFNIQSEALKTWNESVVTKLAKQTKGIMDQADIPLSLKFMILRGITSSGDYSFPIVLPVNPDDWTVHHNKKVNVDYTAGGFVINHWHDDVFNITSSGYIPSFSGRAKIMTSSYANFLKLLRLYINCGKTDISYTNLQTLSTKAILNGNNTISAAQGSLRDKTTIASTETQWVKIEIIYQSEVYVGVFKDFTTTETYDQPSTLKYSFNFIAISRNDLIAPIMEAASYGLNMVNFISKSG